MDIDFSKFKAVMFDYDGTLTAPGVFFVSDELVDRLGELCAAGFPVAVCTGRQLESFLKRFEAVRDRIGSRFGADVLANLYFLGENGAIGYEYNVDSGSGGGNFDVIYKFDWPPEIPKKEFEAELLKALSGKAEILDHLVPIVLRPTNGLNLPFDELNERSAEIYEIIDEFILGYKVGGAGVDGGEERRASDYLHWGNSGLGCLICPAEGDKDSAIRAFYEFLRDKKGVKFEEDCSGGDGQCREIMVIGDNPQKSGNDHFFLNGRYGTPFTVGELPEEGAEMPFVVVDEDGERLLNDKGTLYLLNRIG